MPIFEEKLICPLAVRFSQDHARPEFQKGPDMEETIREIKTKPGTGDFDIVLVPPFPKIEIIRAHLKNGDGRPHWFSLDNRRLYCLQRAAAAAWPLKAAVTVEAMRAPTEGVRKKMNSTVCGLSVGIGHSPHMLTGRWDWRQSVEEKQGLEGDAVAAAHHLVAMDDAKANIQDLPNAEAASNMADRLDRFFQHEEKFGAPAVSSTAEPRSPRSSGSSADSSPDPAAQKSAGKSDHYEVEDWMPDISGAWKDDSENTYKVTVATDLSWTCWRKNQNGSRRKFILWYDAASDSVSWGEDWSFWADASELRGGAGAVRWFAAKDVAKRKPRFQWCKSA